AVPGTDAEDPAEGEGRIAVLELGTAQLPEHAITALARPADVEYRPSLRIARVQSPGKRLPKGIRVVRDEESARTGGELEQMLVPIAAEASLEPEHPPPAVVGERVGREAADHGERRNRAHELCAHQRAIPYAVPHVDHLRPDGLMKQFTN